MWSRVLVRKRVCQSMRNWGTDEWQCKDGRGGCRLSRCCKSRFFSSVVHNGQRRKWVTLNFSAHFVLILCHFERVHGPSLPLFLDCFCCPWPDMAELGQTKRGNCTKYSPFGSIDSIERRKKKRGWAPLFSFLSFPFPTLSLSLSKMCNQRRMHVISDLARFGAQLFLLCSRRVLKSIWSKTRAQGTQRDTTSTLASTFRTASNNASMGNPQSNPIHQLNTFWHSEYSTSTPSSHVDGNRSNWYLSDCIWIRSSVFVRVYGRRNCSCRLTGPNKRVYLRGITMVRIYGCMWRKKDQTRLAGNWNKPWTNSRCYGFVNFRPFFLSCARAEKSRVESNRNELWDVSPLPLSLSLPHS